MKHWVQAYGVNVYPLPKQASRAKRRQWSAARRVVETLFGLDIQFDLKYPAAHMVWGVLTRVAAKVAAYNLGILMHRLLRRPDLAFAALTV
jgi:hypothetical protein